MVTITSNGRMHGTTAASASENRKRARALVIVVSVLILLGVVRSGGLSANSATSSRTLLKHQRGENQRVSLTDSQKALKQLKDISEDSKSATHTLDHSQQLAVKKDPVHVHVEDNAASSENANVEKKVQVKKTATIVTCPACRLNALPLVKRIVYDIAPYFKPALTVNFIRGRDPVLHLYENGQEVDSIALHVSFLFFLSF